MADHHTYFVGTEEWGFAVWAHNAYDATNVAAQLEAEAKTTFDEMLAAYGAKRWKITKNGRELFTSPSRRGPCLSVAVDPETGIYYYAQNTVGKPASGLTAVLQARLDEWWVDHPDYVPNPKTGVPGSHSEFDALNQALRARELRRGQAATEADIREIIIVNIATLEYSGSPLKSLKPRCDICQELTQGARVIPR